MTTNTINDTLERIDFYVFTKSALLSKMAKMGLFWAKNDVIRMTRKMTKIFFQNTQKNRGKAFFTLV